MSGAKILSIAEYNELVGKKKKKKLKYGNRRIEFRGKMFDSEWERDYYQILLHRRKTKQIKDFEIHVDFPIAVEGQPICKINVDFVITNKDGSTSYHDTKSMATITPMFKLKAKLFKALYGAEIQVKLKGKW